MSKLILAVESSCDETACAISQDGRKILSDVVVSQAELHARYGGVVPEIASRKHIETISQAAEQAVAQAGISFSHLDGVAATCAPGLIGALLVGANFAKGLAMSLDRPFIPVHHIRGHVAANYVAFPQLTPPLTALVASGGHTVILDVTGYTDLEVLGASRDDAAGEAFDKIARVLGLPYPGGAAMDALAQKGDSNRYSLPPAIIRESDYDFSFSGLKTAALNLLHNAQQKGQEICREDLAAAVSQTVAQSVVFRVIAAAKARGRKQIAAAGGVAANSFLRKMLKKECLQAGLDLYLPPLALCGDNGSMIACQAFYELESGNVGDLSQNCFATLPASQNVCRWQGSF